LVPWGRAGTARPVRVQALGGGGPPGGGGSDYPIHSPALLPPLMPPATAATAPPPPPRGSGGWTRPCSRTTSRARPTSPSSTSSPSPRARSRRARCPVGGRARAAGAGALGARRWWTCSAAMGARAGGAADKACFVGAGHGKARCTSFVTYIRSWIHCPHYSGTEPSRSHAFIWQAFIFYNTAQQISRKKYRQAVRTQELRNCRVDFLHRGLILCFQISVLANKPFPCLYNIVQLENNDAWFLCVCVSRT
jgi:hypothetical protein